MANIFENVCNWVSQNPKATMAIGVTTTAAAGVGGFVCGKKAKKARKTVANNKPEAEKKPEEKK